MKKNSIPYTGKIISLAFPDTFVRFSDEPISRIFPFLGLGKQGLIKGGHAAFVLIENQTGFAFYYDFGRYITPPGYGRVRGELTDVELKIPIKASFDNKGALSNTEEFLYWLASHPKKTHGSGRLVASVCDFVDYKKANDFVLSVQERGSIPYHTFAKEGSNCSRIVTDTLLASTDVKEIIKPLLRNKKFTPSPLGNVEKGANGSAIFEVKNGTLKSYSNTAFKENILNFFDRKPPISESNDPQKNMVIGADYLSGTGSSAYFKLQKILDTQRYVISRFTEEGKEDFKGIFTTMQEFDPGGLFEFVYDSNCLYCHIKQYGHKIRFDRLEILFP